jgi:hypothetical protein
MEPEGRGVLDTPLSRSMTVFVRSAVATNPDSVIPRCAIAHRGCAHWRRPGIHTPCRGYGFRARGGACHRAALRADPLARPGMTNSPSMPPPTQAPASVAQ